MTLTAPAKAPGSPVALHFEGSAAIGGETVRRPLVPAEDMMQAFIYQHLVPSQELMVEVKGGGRPGFGVRLAEDRPVRIPLGGTARVRVNVPPSPRLQEVQLLLRDPPKGVVLEDALIVRDGLLLTLADRGDSLKAGYADNLIVEAFIEASSGAENAKGAQKVRRVALGVLPAIPIEIVEP
jgi:hypothetical protein